MQQCIVGAQVSLDGIMQASGLVPAPAKATNTIRITAKFSAACQSQSQPMTWMQRELGFEFWLLIRLNQLKIEPTHELSKNQRAFHHRESATDACARTNAKR